MSNTPAAIDENHPHVRLDGDMPRCSECDGTTLVAVERIERHLSVGLRASLPMGSPEPTLHLGSAKTVTLSDLVVLCAECQNTLSTDGYTLQES